MFQLEENSNCERAVNTPTVRPTDIQVCICTIMEAFDTHGSRQSQAFSCLPGLRSRMLKPFRLKSCCRTIKGRRLMERTGIGAITCTGCVIIFQSCSSPNRAPYYVHAVPYLSCHADRSIWWLRHQRSSNVSSGKKCAFQALIVYAIFQQFVGYREMGISDWRRSVNVRNLKGCTKHCRHSTTRYSISRTSHLKVNCSYLQVFKAGYYSWTDTTILRVPTHLIRRFCSRQAS